MLSRSGHILAKREIRIDLVIRQHENGHNVCLVASTTISSEEHEIAEYLHLQDKTSWKYMAAVRKTAFS